MSKKLKLTPPKPIEKPTRGNSKGRPRTNLTVHDYYKGVVLGGLIARSVGVSLTKEHMEQLKVEATTWADFMMDD